MATLINRSRYAVTVKNRPDLLAHFSFNQFGQVEAYVAELRARQLKPHATQLDESWLVRIRQKGHKPLSATFQSEKEAERFISRTADERSRGLFVDYTAALKVSLAELIVRYLLDEAPRHKSRRVIAYSLEGWLADSGPKGLELLGKYREELRKRGQPVRPANFQMRCSSNELVWLHKPLAEVTTEDVETYTRDRLETVMPATVDREIDRLKSIFKVATAIWGYRLDSNPMDAVRRPKYFNERDRRITDDEERRLLEALATLDFKRAVEARLRALADAALAGRVFSSNSARKKVLAKVRAEMLPAAQETAEVVPYLQVFYLFQVMTAARRGEALSLPWKHIDHEAHTAFLPETKNGRARKLVIRGRLVELLSELPRDTARVFDLGVDYVIDAWKEACTMANIADLHIHDLRHEAISRLAETGKFTLPQLQQFSGHLDIRMLMRYAHLTPAVLAEKADEYLKDQEKYRIHHGRKFLNRKAALPPSSLTIVADEPDVCTAVSGSATVAAAAPTPTSSVETELSAAVADKQPNATGAESTFRPRSPGEHGANVIVFPASRIVRRVDGGIAAPLLPPEDVSPPVRAG